MNRKMQLFGSSLFTLGVQLAVTIVLAAPSAVADLQDVQVGGDLRIRGNYWANTFNSGVAPTQVRRQVRWPAGFLPGRPIGSPFGDRSVTSFFSWDSSGRDYRVIEQRTALHVRADFTQDVSAYVELDSFDVWGEDVRSNYLTGFDARAISGDDVEVCQAYIQADRLWGSPLRVRIGRQKLVLGAGWLVGNNSALPESAGLSFDGIRLTYSGDVFSLDAFWTKLNESGVLEEDGDTDFAGLYAGYRGINNIAFDAYWLWLRDATSLSDTNFPAAFEWMENLLRLDNYDVTNLHTVGLRSAGTAGSFDFDAEAAYQFGTASQVGFTFKPFVYGDDRARYDAWAGHVTAGYTFDVKTRPRIWVGAVYLGGEDKRGVSLWERLNPFALFVKPKASVSFNRLFSDTVYSYFMDEMAELSNVWSIRGGVSAHPTETTEVGVDLAYFRAIDAFDLPVFVRLGPFRVPVAPNWSFWTQKSSRNIGLETCLRGKYRYSDDLAFEAGWAHLFAGAALQDGNFVDANGLVFNGGSGKEDANYFYVETRLRF